VKEVAMNAAADAEFTEFMHGRWTQLVRLGYGLTGDQQLAEDLAQTACPVPTRRASRTTGRP
jgi:DNA-directed RNA polymerase specialized sigma24 family protein